MAMRTVEFHYELPPELIAQHPAPARDQSRLLVLDRATRQVVHRRFPDLLEYLRPGDVLVLNNSRVIPARLRAVNRATGGRFEILLLSRNATNDWWTMMRPGRRARLDTQLQLLDPTGAACSITAEVIATNEEGHRRLRFSGTPDLFTDLPRLGEIPLPPYIAREKPQAQDMDRYQTVYGQVVGSVAAPTAGLHFTPALLDTIAGKGVRVVYVTLHVGLGTFAPVKAEEVHRHTMHEEFFEISDVAAAEINAARREGRRVIAVGTTTVRVLESVAARGIPLAAGSGTTRIFIYPPYDFKAVDALVTNFHLPCSTLLMLVSAFAEPRGLGGRDLVIDAYGQAIAERYRFYSYGDAMLLF